MAGGTVARRSWEKLSAQWSASAPHSKWPHKAPLGDVSSMDWLTTKVPPNYLRLEHLPPCHVKKEIKINNCPSHTAKTSTLHLSRWPLHFKLSIHCFILQYRNPCCLYFRVFQHSRYQLLLSGSRWTPPMRPIIEVSWHKVRKRYNNLKLALLKQ